MAKTDRARSQRVARARAEEEARIAAARRAARRRGAIGAGVIVAMVLAVIGVIAAAQADRDRKSAATSTTAGPTTTVAADAVDLPPVAAGESRPGAADCPAADGSSPRVTSFGGPPPNCLDPARAYGAEIVTSEGTIVVDLDTANSPAAVNNFVVLARYHYYDGLPFTSVQRGAYATVDDPPGGPGYTVAPEGKSQQMMRTSLFVGFVPAEGGGSGGALLIAMPGDQAVSIPATAPYLGFIRDARTDPTKPIEDQRTVQQEINDAATPSGAPSEVITIERIVITEEPARP